MRVMNNSHEIIYFREGGQKHSQKAIFVKVFMDLHENNCFREGVEKTLTESM